MSARRLAAVAAAGLVVAVAGAAAPAGATPPDPPYEQVVRCVADVASVPSLSRAVSGAQRALGWAALGDLSRGDGVTVAVIDTGVNPHPLLGDRLVAGGDDLEPDADRPGLDDCDGHGTLVAGLVAGGPDRRTGFTGVAPGAQVLSIRQTTGAYVRVTADGREPVGDEASLAAAVRRAVRLGADVVNISSVHCSSDISERDPDLVAAVRDAIAADVVVVAAAGNLGDECAEQNTPADPMRTVATPADIDGVLTVGSVAADGTPSDFSLAGEWVDVAAPGEALVSIDPQPGHGGEVGAVTTTRGRSPINGTSFAAPVVSGLVALVRSRYPDLTARQVVDRITATASRPSAPGGRDLAVGHGVVNPRLALTAVIPAEGAAGRPVAPAARAEAMPAMSGTADDRDARLVAYAGSGALLALLTVVLGWRAVRRRPAA